MFDLAKLFAASDIEESFLFYKIEFVAKLAAALGLPFHLNHIQQLFLRKHLESLYKSLFRAFAIEAHEICATLVWATHHQVTCLSEN